MLVEMTSIWFWYAVKPLTPMNNESLAISLLSEESRNVFRSAPREAPNLRSASRVKSFSLDNRRRVDVGEYVLLHRIRVDRGDHHTIFDADHHRGIAHHEQRLLGPFGSGLIGHLIHAVHIVGAEGDVARLETLHRVC